MPVDPRAVPVVVAAWIGHGGLPEEVRLDNGSPWGAAGNDFLPDLALWLLGWDWRVRGNRPRQKQGNAVVERDHGVLQRWAEPQTCGRAAELQARLDRCTAVQRERYPVGAARQSRLATYPALAAGGRRANPPPDGHPWDEHRVWTWLGERVFGRRVDKAGTISLANRAVGVGKAGAGQEVTVRLAVQDGGPVWRIRDAHGDLLRQQPARELSPERLQALDVSRKRPQRRQQAKAHAHPPV